MPCGTRRKSAEAGQPFVKESIALGLLISDEFGEIDW
jgi:hypothetical protein